jgi:putative flippase GtrA
MKQLLDKNKKHIKDLIIYFGIAAIGAAVNVSSRVLYGFYTGFGTSIVLAYLTGMMVAFVLTKLFAFDSRKSGKVKREAVKFFMISMIAMTVTWGVSEIALRLIIHFISENDLSKTLRETAAHIAGMGVGFFVNFFGHKLITFKNTGFGDKIKKQHQAFRRNIKTNRSK